MSNPTIVVSCPMCKVVQSAVISTTHSFFCEACDEPIRVCTRVQRAVTGWTCEDCIERDCFFSRHNVTGNMPEDMAAEQFAEEARAASQYGVDVDTYRRWMADVPEKPWYA